MKARSILLVHPDREPAREIASGLRRAGFDVVTVPDGERAIDRFIQEPFSVLVTEMALPGRDGGTTAESIRWAPRGQELVVVLLATRGTGEEALREAAARNQAARTYLGAVDVAAIVELVVDAAENMRPTTPEVSGRAPVNNALRATAQGNRVAAPSVPAGDVVIPLVNRPELTPDWRAGDDPSAVREGRAIESYAADDDRNSAVFIGSLGETPFPELLYRVGAMRSSGALVLSDNRDRRRTTTGEHCKKAVFFRVGVPVYVQSNLVEECLGHILARAGRISPEQLEESLLRMRQGDARQGTVLLEMGAIDPRELRDALQDQLRVKLFDLFSWNQGDFRFSTRMAPPAETVTLEMSLPETVLRGIVHRVAPTRLLGLMSPYLDQYVVPRPERLQAFSGVSMPDEARRVLRGLNGSRKLRDVLAEAGERPGAAAQLVYALQCVDGVEFRDQPSNEASPAALDAAPTATGTSDELRRAALLLREDRFAEAVGVPLNSVAAPEAIRQMRERFLPFTEPGSAQRGLRALAYEVTARLSRLERSLADSPAIRPTSPRGLPRPEPRAPEDTDSFDQGPTFEEHEGSSRPPPATESPNRGATLQLPGRSAPREASTRFPSSDPPSDSQDVGGFVDRAIDAARRPPSSSDHPLPTVGGHGAGPLAPSKPPSRTDVGFGERTVDDGQFPQLNSFKPTPGSASGSSSAPLMPGALSPRHGMFDDETEMAGEDDPLRPLTIPQEAPSDTDLDARVHRLYQAERFFRRGCRALARDRYDGAIDAFEHAVALCPDEGEFVAHLAYARFLASRDPRDTDRALSDLRRGIELSPKLASVHVLLARVCKVRGESQLAREAFTQALAADPECQEAIDGLSSLGVS